MITATKGLIIKEQKVGESDRLVWVLTSHLGLIRAFATGALKIKSKNITATQLLSYSGLDIYHSPDTYKIGRAESIDVFFGLREDIVSLALASFFCELLLQTAPENEPAEDYLKITLNCLYFLCKKQLPTELIKSIFELKILKYSGYCPDFSCCCKCKSVDMKNVSFDIKGGVVFCEKCSGESATPVPGSVFAAMRHIIGCEDKRLFSFKLSEQSIDILSEITEKFLIAQTERDYKALDFYKQVK